MTQSSRTLFQRIRCIKSSLDKAEQSFMDNKDIRGELDLMLAVSYTHLTLPTILLV